MLKKIKFKNSTILTIGIFLLFVGVAIGFYEYFEQRKNKTFSEMNILLFESEQPQNIIVTDEENEDTNPIDEEGNQEVENNDEPSETEPPQQNISYTYLGILEIPKINVKRGFFDLNSSYNNVDKNVTVINGSTYPNEENNNLILAAHSGNCSYCYFDKLYKLSLGDKAYIYFNNLKYTYEIVDIYEVEKDGTVPIYRDYDKNVLTLITCTRNSNTKQTVYILEQTN